MRNILIQESMFPSCLINRATLSYLRVLHQQRCGSATLPGLFLSLLQHRPHELLRSTGVEHKERLTQQRMLLAHRHKSKWTVRRKVEIMMPRLPLPVEWLQSKDCSEGSVWSLDEQSSTRPLTSDSDPLTKSSAKRVSLYHRDLLRDDLLPQVSASSPTLSLSRLHTDEFSFHSSALCSAVYVSWLCYSSLTKHHHFHLCTWFTQNTESLERATQQLWRKLLRWNTANIMLVASGSKGKRCGILLKQEDTGVGVCVLWLPYVWLTQGESSEIQHRSAVAARVQDVILVLKHVAAAFRQHADCIVLITAVACDAIRMKTGSNNRLWRKRHI